MSSSCDWTDPLSCGASIIGSAVTSSAVPAAWDAVCKSFADAAAQLLAAFGKAFAALPDVRLSTAGIAGTYGVCLAIAGAVAALLVFGQVIRTAWTHDGSGLAQAVTGVAKAVLAWLLTAAVATAALAAADEVTRFIVDTSFGSQQALAVRLGEHRELGERCQPAGRGGSGRFAAAGPRAGRDCPGGRAVVRAAAAQRRDRGAHRDCRRSRRRARRARRPRCGGRARCRPPSS